ncbi:MAG TPA: hypothetical protein VNJ53_11480 [Gaiellaceae bacterium]|nr:hypothetical protein [Gaiellaceae bacterium]
MRARIWTVAAALGLAAALVAVPAALAAYGSPQLEIRQAGSATTVKASQSPDDDATAAVRILAPAGTQLTTTQAPGTVLGTVRALVVATQLANSQLPIEGQVVVAAPGQVPAQVVSACVGPATPAAVWLLALSAAGQQLSVPMFVLANPVTIAVCLPHPSQATFGAKLISAEFSVNGVFSPVPLGAWISLWVPYDAAGAVNVAGTVAAPAAVAPGAVTAAARRQGQGAIVTGRVTQAGQPRGGVTVVVFGGTTRSALRRLGSVKANAAGSYTFRAKRGTFFRARAVAGPAAAAPLCAAIASQLGGVPCVNPTTTGFTVDSRVVRKR